MSLFARPSELRPKLIDVLREGYGPARFSADVFASLTVAIVALPLAMAIAIASGATPQQGLVTVVVGGLIISLLGGSRVQIGGPTGAFIVVVYGVIARHGYDGLLLATLMAGAILVVAAALGLGRFIKYIPDPVVVGFTSGIAVIIFSSQIRDLLGLQSANPAAFLEKFPAFWAARETLSVPTLALSAACIGAIFALRKLAPKAPAFLLVVVGAALMVGLLGLPIETIADRFGETPRSFPAPALPEITLARLQALLPDAAVIAFLAGVESLLSAMVADGMTGRRHRSNAELLAQGAANIASPLFGGLPATGAIARTATNVRSGGRTPVAGILHALLVLAAMLIAAPLVGLIPLCALAAVLTVVAMNMAEAHRFIALMRADWGERVILLLTFGLTVMVDLTMAIQVGVVLASFLFMARMAETVEARADSEEAVDDEDRRQRSRLPKGVESFLVRGPLFFGVVGRVGERLATVGESPRAFILRLRDAPLIDASGAAIVAGLARRLAERGVVLIISAAAEQPRAALARAGVTPGELIVYADDFDEALRIAGAPQDHS